MESRVIELIMGAITLIASGGWWVSWKSNKRLKYLEVENEQFELFKKSLDFSEERLRMYEVRILELEKQVLELKKQIFSKYESDK